MPSPGRPSLFRIPSARRSGAIFFTASATSTSAPGKAPRSPAASPAARRTSSAASPAPQASIIDGALRSEIAGADFWLINPQGLVIGPTATLSVPASFYAGGADALLLQDGGRFVATDPEWLQPHGEPAGRVWFSRRDTRRPDARRGDTPSAGRQDAGARRRRPRFDGHAPQRAERPHRAARRHRHRRRRAARCNAARHARRRARRTHAEREPVANERRWDGWRWWRWRWRRRGRRAARSPTC